MELWSVWLALIAFYALQSFAATIELNVTNEVSTIPSPRYGINLENINRAIDGGLAPNRVEDPGMISESFGKVWQAVNDKITVTKDQNNPLNSAITTSARLSVPLGETGVTGLENRAFGGFKPKVIRRASFWIKGAFEGPMTVRLFQDSIDREGYRHRFQVRSTANEWTQIIQKYPPPNPTPDRKRSTARIGPERKYALYSWQLIFNASLLAGRSINIAYPMFMEGSPGFPEVKAPGKYEEVSEYSLAVEYAQFPGGRNLQGFSPDNRWKWNETIGPLFTRPGRLGPYMETTVNFDKQRSVNTDTFGLEEFFRHCAKAFTRPVLAIWSGLPLQPPPELNLPRSSPVTGAALQPYIDDALAELDFLLGDASTPGGQLRASLGRESPYSLQWVKIGNEDDQSGGCASYPERLTRFYNAIRDAYPSLILIASTDNKACLPDPLPNGLMLEAQTFDTPDNLVKRADEFGNYDPANPIMVGKFAATRWFGHNVRHSSIQTACAEFVYMLGWERHRDVVQMGAYATYMARRPVFKPQDDNHYFPYLFDFGGRFSEWVYQVSYYAFRLASGVALGSVVRVASNTKQGPVYWMAYYRKPYIDAYFVKMANYQAKPARLDLRIPGKRNCRLYHIQGAYSESNSWPKNPEQVTDPAHPIPADITPDATENGVSLYQLNLDPYEFGVLQCLGLSHGISDCEVTADCGNRFYFKTPP